MSTSAGGQIGATGTNKSTGSVALDNLAKALPVQPNESTTAEEFKHHYMAAKWMARQQLRVSEDSPFWLEWQSSSGQLEGDNHDERDARLEQICAEKARLLREETEEIAHQLDLMRAKLGELQDGNGKGLTHEPEQIGGGSAHSREVLAHERSEQSTASPEPTLGSQSQAPSVGKRSFAENQQITSSDNQFHPRFNDRPEARQSDEAAAWEESAERSSRTELQAQSLDHSGATAKYRPLTGKTDCPNCACDKRSICDECAELQQPVRAPTFLASWGLGATAPQRRDKSRRDRPTSGPAMSHDERPIRPAVFGARDEQREELSKTKQALAVDQTLVPGRLFAIGRALDEKRTKLARAIEELQAVTERVRKRGERLEEERKVAQLYKEQWRRGPQIGHQQSGAATGAPVYSSRLDPRLMHDTNSLMAFRRTRQASGTNMRLRQNERAPAPPTPRPRQSKLSQMSPFGATRPTCPTLSFRSRSLESLAPGVRPAARTLVRVTPPRHTIGGSRLSVGTRSTNEDIRTRGRLLGRAPQESESVAQNVGAEVATGKTNNHNNHLEDGPAVEEEIEADIVEGDQVDRKRQGTEIVDEENVGRHQNGSRQEQREQREQEQQGREQQDEPSHEQGQRARRMTWVPVFGETEIKTVQRRTPSRKVAVLGGNESSASASAGAMSAPHSRPPGQSILRLRRSQSALGRRHITSTRVEGADRVLGEAKRKLQFANDLLENERRDSRERNQVIVMRPGPQLARNSSPGRRQLAASASGTKTEPVAATKQQACTKRAGRAQQALTSVSNRPSPQGGASGDEIRRLESMIAQQRQLLCQLGPLHSGQRHRATARPPGPTECECSCGCAWDVQGHASPGAGGWSTRAAAGDCALIGHLRERLNRTRARLARTLEAERARHERREQSARRKQTNLEQENELLRRSLGQCIDACLRDIASTFESLSDTLASAQTRAPPTSPAQTQRPMGDEQTVDETDRADKVGQLMSSVEGAAQLIASNQQLHRMRTHIESVERQRRAIFDELANEKQRARHLETELRATRLQQMSAESSVTSPSPVSQQQHKQPEPMPSTSKASGQRETLQAPDESDRDDLSTSRTASHSEELQTGTGTGNNNNNNNNTGTGTSTSTNTSTSSNASTSTSAVQLSSNTFASLDLYRQYIESVTPDLDAIRRERRQILTEFDNIKRMLADLNESN